MLCPKCGYYSDREESVCPECGKDLFPELPDGAGNVAPIRGEYKATEDLKSEEEEDNAE